MPGVNPSNDRWLATTIKNILQRLTNLEGQQNGGVRNAQNQLRLQWGLLPDGTYGLVAYDNAGNKRAQLGQLPDGDFGFATYSPANNGSYVELNVPQASPSSGTISTASTSFTTIAGSPTLTVACGASGTMLITLSGTLGLPSIANEGVRRRRAHRPRSGHISPNNHHPRRCGAADHRSGNRSGDWTNAGLPHPQH
jgi:hypothetical protein